MMWISTVVPAFIVLIFNYISIASIENPSNKRQQQQPEAVDEVNLPHRRIINHFATKQEISKLLELIKIVEPSMVEQYRGLLYVSGRELLNLEPNPQHFNANMSIFDSVNARLNLVRNVVNIVRRIHAIMRKHFQAEMILESMIVGNQRPNGEIFHFNQTNYAHGVHIDQCNLRYDYNRSCLRNHNYFRHFTAVLYTNDCIGGDLVFIDPHLRPTKSKFDVEKELGRKLGENDMYCDNPPCVGYATITTIKPQPGKLAIFTSGPENIHGVTEVHPTTSARYTLSLWFTRRSAAEELIKAHERGEKVDLFLLQQVGYRFQTTSNQRNETKKRYLRLVGN